MAFVIGFLSRCSEFLKGIGEFPSQGFKCLLAGCVKKLLTLCYSFRHKRPDRQPPRKLINRKGAKGISSSLEKCNMSAGVIVLPVWTNLNP